MTRDENYFRRFSVGTVTTSSIDNPRGTLGSRAAEIAKKYTMRPENTRDVYGLILGFFSFL